MGPIQSDFARLFEQAVRESYPPAEASRILSDPAEIARLTTAFWQQFDAGANFSVDPSTETAEEKLQRAEEQAEAQVGLVARPGVGSRRARFILGELVHLKGCKFTVVEIGPDTLVLEPVAPSKES